MRSSQKHRSQYLLQLLIGILIGAALTLIFLLGFPSNPAQENSSTSELRSDEVIEAMEPSVGALAPKFRLQDIHGSKIDLDDFRGSVVLLNFWATWCGPCRLEMPLLEDHYRDYGGEDFTILAVNLGESLNDVGAFVDEFGLTFPVLLDPMGEVSKLYRVIGYPSSVVIDPEGRIAKIHVGILSETQLGEYLRLAGLPL